MNVGFVGLGNIGAPAALSILRGGWPLTVYARRPEALEPFRNTNATIAGSLREVGERSDLVCICVVDDAGVEDVMVGDDGILAGMKPGGVIAVLSTIHPSSCQRLADAAAEGGVALLDAPISGGADGAAAGTLAVMAGGDEAAFERCLPVFQSFGALVRHLGPLGSGQLAKLVNNTLYTATIKLVDEAMALGGQLGLNRTALAEMLLAGSASSFVLKRYAQTDSVAYWGQRSSSLLHKDVGLLIETAHARGLAAPAVEAVARQALDLIAPALSQKQS